MILENLTEDIFYGTKIMESHLSKNEKEYLYLTESNILDGGRIDIENSFFISKKVINKYYKRTFKTLNYGDYIILKRDNKLCIERIEENKIQIIPNDKLIVLNGSFSYFDNAIKDRNKRKYLYEKLDILSRKYNGRNLLNKLKQVDFEVGGIFPSEEPNKFEEFERESLDAGSIKITDTKMTIQNIVRRIKLGKINMLTEFQRTGNLWDIKAQSRLIESIMIGFPIPSFYFDCSDDNNWLIVDGLQRLSAFENFIIKQEIEQNGKYRQPFRLENLEYLPQYNDKKFSDLPTEMQFQIEDYNIRVLKIEDGTPQRVKYSLFERINTGGLVLSSQEIRHALNQKYTGDINPALYIKKLSELEPFKKIWGAKKKDRMQDREAILRYVVFRIVDYKGYKPEMKEFLDIGMEELYNKSELTLKEIQEDLIKALELVTRIWANDFSDAFAFGNRKFNSALFEVICYYFSLLDDDEVLVLRRNRSVFLGKYNELLEDNDYKLALNQNTIASVNNRFEKFNEMLKEILKNDK